MLHRPGRASCACGIVLIAVAAAPIAQSQAQLHRSQSPYRLEYRGTARCPDGAGFLAELAARTKVQGSGSANPVTIRVVVEEQQQGRVQGNVHLADGSKTLTGGSCEEVLSGLALVAALVLDPDAYTGPLEPPAPAPAGPSIAPVAAAPPAPRLKWAAGLGGLVAGGIIPEPLWGAALFADARRRGGGPAVRLSLALALPATVSRTEGAARFRYGAVAPEGCWSWAQKDDRLRADACVGTAVGLLEGTGITGATVAQTTTVRRLWLAPQIATRGSLVLLPNWSVELALLGAVPLTRTRFRFEQPRLELSRASAVVVTAIVGVSVGF